MTVRYPCLAFCTLGTDLATPSLMGQERSAGIENKYGLKSPIFFLQFLAFSWTAEVNRRILTYDVIMGQSAHEEICTTCVVIIEWIHLLKEHQSCWQLMLLPHCKERKVQDWPIYGVVILQNRTTTP